MKRKEILLEKTTDLLQKADEKIIENSVCNA